MIGDIIKELRKKASLTQQELAKKLEISPSAVGMYEQNRREPPYDLVLKLSQLFSVTSDYLLFGNDPALASPQNLYKTKNDDFDSIIDNLKNELSSQSGLMFKGELLDDSDIEKIFEAMKIGAEVALKSKKRK